MNVIFKRFKTLISLFCLSFFLVITLSCGPTITVGVIAAKVDRVVTLIDATDKALNIIYTLVDTYYKTLGDDIENADPNDIENTEEKTNYKFSNETIEKMEARHLDLATKHEDLDDYLNQTEREADELFSMLKTQANKNSNDSQRQALLTDISNREKAFSEKISIAESFSSKIRASIKEYENILIVFQVSVGTAELQSYIQTVDSVINKYSSLEQEVQAAINEGRQLIISTNTESSPSQISKTTTSAPSNSEATTSAPSSSDTTTSVPSNSDTKKQKTSTPTPSVSTEPSPKPADSASSPSRQSKSSSSKTEFPISLITFPTGQTGLFVVPNNQTTPSAYGGDLRFYDVHIAKMIEITHYVCKNLDSDSPLDSIDWRYQAGNGNIEMGTFTISCSLADDIAQEYDLGKVEDTPILISQSEGTVNVPIPTLKITGNKVSRWRNFTAGFEPN